MSESTKPEVGQPQSIANSRWLSMFLAIKCANANVLSSGAYARESPWDDSGCTFVILMPRKGPADGAGLGSSGKCRFTCMNATTSCR